MGRIGFPSMIIAALLAGCASTPPSATEPPPQPAPTVSSDATPPATTVETPAIETPPIDRNRANGYALLYDLLAKQRNVDKILVMKRPSAPTAELLRDIAKTTGAAAKELETMARREADVDLRDPGLPEIEAEKRRGLEKATQQALLFGDQFETRMLVSQADGLLAGQHLALALATDERDPGSAAWLRALADELGELRERAIELLAN